MRISEALLERRHKEAEPDSNCNVITLFSGDYYVSNNPDDMLVTILGSCVSACIRDPIAKVGGMNHFLLPGDETMTDFHTVSNAARYGVFAMEKLINSILSVGGRKDRLEVKVFGGGNVINNSMRIGSKNAAFVQHFLHTEGLAIHSEDLEGDLPRRIHYFPRSGKVMVRKLRRKEDMQVVEAEAQYRQKITLAPVEGAIDLF